MYYIRNPLPGTDEWNRALDFAGRCKSLDNDGTPYEALLPCNGGIVLVMANVYAYR